jgi:hypothetical protein
LAQQEAMGQLNNEIENTSEKLEAFAAKERQIATKELDGTIEGY